MSNIIKQILNLILTRKEKQQAPQNPQGDIIDQVGEGQ